MFTRSQTHIASTGFVAGDENKVVTTKSLKSSSSATVGMTSSTTAAAAAAQPMATRAAFGDVSNRQRSTTAIGQVTKRPASTTVDAVVAPSGTSVAVKTSTASIATTKAAASSNSSSFAVPLSNRDHNAAPPSKVQITESVSHFHTSALAPSMMPAFPFEPENRDPMDLDHSGVVHPNDEFEEPIEDIDAGDADDPLFCTDFVGFIYAYLHKKEILDKVPPMYMSQQLEIDAHHRTILVDWLSDVAIKFKLLPETLFLAVYVLDKYLSLKAVARDKLQLIGTASLLVAAKFEEIYTPEVKDFVWITGGAYNTEELLKAEKQILVALDFQLSTPSPLHFLRRFSKAARSDSKVHTLSKYIIELSMLEYGLLKFTPSQLAAAAVYISRKMSHITPSWTPTLRYHTRLSEAELMPCVRELNALVKIQGTEANKYKSIWKKFASDKFMKVAGIPVWNGDQ